MSIYNKKYLKIGKKIVADTIQKMQTLGMSGMDSYKHLVKTHWLMADLMTHARMSTAPNSINATAAYMYKYQEVELRKAGLI